MTSLLLCSFMRILCIVSMHRISTTMNATRLFLPMHQPKNERVVQISHAIFVHFYKILGKFKIREQKLPISDSYIIGGKIPPQNSLQRERCIMKKRKILAAAMATMLCSLLPMQVSAAEGVDEQLVPLATGLITDYELIGSYGYNTLMIDASTIGSAEMAKIGIVDIVVQHSSDKVNWVDEVSVSDMLNEDAYNFYLNDYGVPVISGYYYRVVVTHYAKEQGWFFPDTESIENASTAVWIG